jgi:hypothetical protein
MLRLGARRIVAVVREGDYDCVSEQYRSHMWKRLLERSVNRHHDCFPLSTDIEHPWITFELRKFTGVVLRGDLQARLSQRRGENYSPQTAVEKIVVLTPPLRSGSI